MLTWVTPMLSGTAPHRLIEAYNRTNRRLYVDRYRSRTDVTHDHIATALSWFRLPKLENDELVQTEERRNILYATFPVPRGIAEEEAMPIMRAKLTHTLQKSHEIKIITFNTRSDAGNSAALKAWLEAQPESWTHLNVNTMLISAPTHKIDMYMHANENKRSYIILNNLDTPSVVFKIAAAIMMSMNKFGDDTEQFVQTWLTGDEEKICTLVDEYYKNYDEQRKQTERKTAIAELGKHMTQSRDDEFKRRMSQIETTIGQYLSEISTLNEDLNRVKGEYLLYTLENNNEKIKELETFFETCGSKLEYLHYSNNRLYFVYNTSLMYYEPELLNRYFESTRDNCVTTADPDIKQLLKEIFIDKKYTVLIESGAYLDINNARVMFFNPTDVIPMDELNGIANPHHKYYNCWGDNAPNITEAMINKDYITAISTVFAAMAGINISDTAVLSKFVQDELQRYNVIPFLKNTETGETITVDEYKRRYQDNASNAANQ